MKMNKSDFVFTSLLLSLPCLDAKKKNIFPLFKILAGHFYNLSLFG